MEQGKAQSVAGEKYLKPQMSQMTQMAFETLGFLAGRGRHGIPQKARNGVVTLTHGPAKGGFRRSRK
jgi:hypothetical protein